MYRNKVRTTRNFATPSEYPSINKNFFRPRRYKTVEESDFIRLKLGIECRSETSAAPPQPVDEWDELGINDRLFSILVRKLRLPSPTPIQAQAFSTALSGKNLIGIALTGSGKTLSYVLPMLVHTESKPCCKPGEGPHAIVLVPNRELATAVCRQIDLFETSLRIAVVFGGEHESKQIDQLDGNTEIVVACPGRFADLLQRKEVSIGNLSFVVIDEADALQGERMKGPVDKILSAINPDRQLLLFTATWQDCLNDYTEKYMRKDPPLVITVGGEGLKACENVRQTFALCGDRGKSKLDTLVDFLRDPPSIAGRTKCLVFVQKLEAVRPLVQDLRDAGIAGVQGFDGDYKEELLHKFHDDENMEVQVVVATSALGRGHDFLSLGSVINYDVFWGKRGSIGWKVDYVHRIGRTGRAGREGLSLTLMEQADLRFARDLEDLVKASLPEDRRQLPDWLLQAALPFVQNRLWKQHWESQREVPPVPTTPEPAVPQVPARLESRMDEYLARTGGRSCALPRFAEADEHY